MQNHHFSETRLIGFWTVFTIMVFGPVIAVVYAMYSFGYWLYRTTAHVPGQMILVYPYLVVFSVVNTAHNWLICSILFCEWPREFLTTSRLKRHKTSPDAWRRELADMLGGFLNSQDGGHY